jgi:hypothetical protein
VVHGVPQHLVELVVCHPLHGKHQGAAKWDTWGEDLPYQRLLLGGSTLTDTLPSGDGGSQCYDMPGGRLVDLCTARCTPIPHCASLYVDDLIVILSPVVTP